MLLSARITNICLIIFDDICFLLLHFRVQSHFIAENFSVSLPKDIFDSNFVFPLVWIAATIVQLTTDLEQMKVPNRCCDNSFHSVVHIPCQSRIAAPSDISSVFIAALAFSCGYNYVLIISIHLKFSYHSTAQSTGDGLRAYEWEDWAGERGGSDKGGEAIMSHVLFCGYHMFASLVPSSPD